MQKEIKYVKEDSNKVKILDALSFTYSDINPDSGLVLGKQALELSEHIKWNKGIAVSHADIGVNYAAMSDYSKALDHEFKALKIYETLGQRKSVAAMLCNIAIIYKELGDYPRALEHNFKALKIFEEIADKRSSAITLENIGTLYLDQKNYPKTTEYYSTALRINEELRDSIGIARNIGNIGIVNSAGGDYQKALVNHYAALEINRKLGLKRSMQINLANIGIVYRQLNEFRLSLEYQSEALQISKEMGNKNGVAENMGNIGETYFAMAKGRRGDATNLNNAISYLEKAVGLCREINYIGPLPEFMSQLSDAYSLSGNYKKALEYHRLHTQVKDSINSVQTKIQISNLENERRLDIQEKSLLIKDKQIQIAQLKIQQRQNERILLVLGMILLLLILGITLKAIISYRKRNRQLLEDKKLSHYIIDSQTADIKLRDQALDEIAHMQSHDMRGAVATIMGLSKLFNHQDYTDPNNKVVLEGIIASAEKLDAMIKEVVTKENALDKNT